MAGGNRYLDGLPRPRNQVVPLLYALGMVVLTIWLVGLFGHFERRPVASERPVAADAAPSGSGAAILRDPAYDRVGAAVGFGAAAMVASAFVLARRGRKAMRLRRDAERLFLAGDSAGAVAKARAGLQRRPSQRFWLLCLLGSIAEDSGDFRESADIFAQAEAALGSATLRAVLGPMANGPRAFALAALGDLRGAEACLASVPPNTHVGAIALAVRARALVLAQRGAHAELLELIERERLIVRRGLDTRDRALLGALTTLARHATAGSGADAPAAPPSRHAPWIVRVHPRAGALWSRP